MTTLTSKGQVTIPKRIRDELQLLPGSQVQFSVNDAGELVLHRPRPAEGARRAPADRFEAVRGSADVRWRTDELMKLLRADDRRCWWITNVLVDVLQDDPQWAGWSIAQMQAQAVLHPLAINPIIYAEMSLSFTTLEALDKAVAMLQLELHEVPRPALFVATRAFQQYRRRGGTRQQVLPDFFIGAHAAVKGWPLLTRDASRFKTCFPTLTVLSP